MVFFASITSFLVPKNKGLGMNTFVFHWFLARKSGGKLLS